jgi:hypothetical protein
MFELHVVVAGIVMFNILELIMKIVPNYPTEIASRRRRQVPQARARAALKLALQVAVSRRRRRRPVPEARAGALLKLALQVEVARRRRNPVRAEDGESEEDDREQGCRLVRLRHLDQLST